MAISGLQMEGSDPAPPVMGGPRTLRARNGLLDVAAIVFGMLLALFGFTALSVSGSNPAGWIGAATFLPTAILIMPFTIAWLRKRGFPDNAFMHVAMVIGVAFVGSLTAASFVTVPPPAAVGRRTPASTNAHPPTDPWSADQQAAATPATVPTKPYRLVGPHDPLRPVQDALNRDDYREADRLFTSPAVTEAERRSERGVALRYAINAAANRDNGAADAVERLATYALPQIKGLATSAPTTPEEL